jgi:hypothetical protein
MGSCERGYEHSCTIKGDKFLDQLSDHLVAILILYRNLDVYIEPTSYVLLIF